MAKNDSIDVLETKIKLLRGARRRIEIGADSYVCIAISSSLRDWWNSDNYYKESQAADSLKGYIQKHLGVNVSLEYWMGRHKKYNNIDQSPKAMRQYRLQWIDWLVLCLEEDLTKKKGK